MQGAPNTNDARLSVPGVSEDALKEFSMMFKHFDKDKSGRLNHQEFKSCLRALGYDLPMVEESQPDPEFDAILGEMLLCIVLVILSISASRCQ